MFDIAKLLNVKLYNNPKWRVLAEKVEDLINNTVGSATDESMNAIGSPYRYLRGDTVDPRTFPDLEPISDTVQASLLQLIDQREREATIRVVMPADKDGNSQIYMDLDGTTYVASANRFHKRDLLIQEAKQLGFDFFSDDLTDADYSRVLLFVSQYWPQSGSHEALASFLGFIRDIRIDLVQLWTVEDEDEDGDQEAEYELLERFNNRMTPVWNGGRYYPTFLYDLHYDAFANTDVNELRRLFFMLAPIHLVLRRMVETIRSEATAYAVGAPLVNATHSMSWTPLPATESRYRKTRFVLANINMPLPLVAPNLELSGLAVAAFGDGGVWILERDPAIANPSDPVAYMLDHGWYVAPSTDPENRFEFPAYGVPKSGLWVMATVPNTGCLIEIT